MKKKIKNKSKKIKFQMPSLFNNPTDIHSDYNSKLVAENAGRYITIFLGVELSDCVVKAISERKIMGYDPKYVEFILPDEIMGLKVLK